MVNVRWDSELARLSTYGAQEMVNARCEMKSYYKYELAQAAGVSTRTFGRWLKQQNEQLIQWGVTPQQQLLPPAAVQWICRQYGIDEREL